MGLIERHAYRFGYLKSEGWQNLRIQKLADEDAMCFYCNHRSLSNDVHHVYYAKSLKDTTVKDLRVLCREHHTRMHELIDAEIEKNPPTDRTKSGQGFRIFRVCSTKIESEMRRDKRKCYSVGGVKIKPVKIEKKEANKKIRSLEKLHSILGSLKNMKCDAGLRELPYLMHKVEFTLQGLELVVGELRGLCAKETTEEDEKKLADFIQNNFIDHSYEPIIHDDSRAG